jgi:hypothetical protein
VSTESNSHTKVEKILPKKKLQFLPFVKKNNCSTSSVAKKTKCKLFIISILKIAEIPHNNSFVNKNRTKFKFFISELI